MQMLSTVENDEIRDLIEKTFMLCKAHCFTFMKLLLQSKYAQFINFPFHS